MMAAGSALPGLLRCGLGAGCRGSGRTAAPPPRRVMNLALRGCYRVAAGRGRAPGLARSKKRYLAGPPEPARPGSGSVR